MNRIIATIALWSLLICAVPFPAVTVHAQATPARINIIANGSITDIGGAPIVTGKLSVIATNDRDTPVAVNVGGQQQSVAQAIDRPISNGSLALALQLPNPAVSTPAPLRYRITIRNNDVTPASITVYRNVDVEDDGTGNWDLGHSRWQIRGCVLQMVPRSKGQMCGAVPRPHCIQGIPGCQ